MNRRDSVLAILALGLAGGLPRSAAQAPDKLRRIGFLGLRSEPNEFDAAFREGMRALGYVEGRTLEIECRWAAGSEQRAEAFAAELVARNIEVIVTATTSGIRAAMRATKKIPIVMAASSDPVGAGLVASLARPGGNVTGLSLVSTDTGAKRLQILRELAPSATRIAVLLNQTNAGPGAQVNSLLVGQLEAAARQMGMSLTVNYLGAGAELASIFGGMQRARAQALIVQAGPLTIDNRARVVELAAQHRLPALYEIEGFVDAGGLISYGPSIVDMYRRAAGYVDRILKGAKPADMPVELPNKFDLVINLGTARALGLQVQRSLILRADRVID
jgi:putative tryptophan/tyrosine transport system substrate-binding protein